MEKKLNILTNEMDRLTATGSQDAQEPTRPEPVTLVSVERTPGPHGNTFTVNFTKNFPEVFYLAVVGRNKIASGFHTEDSDGVSTLSFSCDDSCEGAATVDVTFTNRAQSSEVVLELNNEGTRSLLQTDFTVPALDIQHDGDLVYDTRTDVKVKISSSSGEEMGFSDLRYSLVTFERDGAEYSTRRRDAMVGELDSKLFLRSQEKQYVISTSEHTTSGFFRLYLSFEGFSAPIVKELKVQKSLVLRPESQTGPYPEDFLKFLNTHSSSGSFTVQQSCMVGTNCTLSCSAIGPITGMQVSKLQADGENWESVEDITESVFEYSRSVDWIFRPTEDSEDMTYRCVVLSATKNISLDTNVTIVSQEFYINGSTSSIYTDEDQVGPDSGLLRINCSIMGRPVRDAGIQLVFQEPNLSRSMYARYSQHISAQIVPVRPGESVAQVAVPYDPLATPYEGFLGARCNARSDLYRHTEYDIPWSPPSSQDELHQPAAQRLNRWM
ncbi:hypothetical protein RRG08_011606 [Elysia crispata]|uniref:Uncharacterized protein n=1 Tax=Elysia crispata TaxID=231223 RepID=A0AAE0XPE1_9GAST|nr:hypothetical protein RRG08_011606 [Elysia crispata]